MLALVEVFDRLRGRAHLEGLLVELALEGRALIVGGEIELDLGLVGLVGRALGDRGLGRVALPVTACAASVGQSSWVSSPNPSPSASGSRVAETLIAVLFEKVNMLGPPIAAVHPKVSSGLAMQVPGVIR